MKNSKYYVIGALFVLTLSLLFYSGRSPRISDGSGQSEYPEQKQSESILPVNNSLAKQNFQKKKYTISPEEFTALKKSMPDKEVVREEVKKDPHKTPESLLNFAQKTGPLMEKALKSKSSAHELIGTLKDCALDETVADAARALCVSNIEKIVKTHPEHKGKFQDIKKNLSPDVNKLLRKKAMLRN